MRFLMTILLSLSAAATQIEEGVVTGQILNSEGNPVVGSRVMAMEVGCASLAETDKDGRYRLDRLPPGRYYILTGLVDAPTYYPVPRSARLDGCHRRPGHTRDTNCACEFPADDWTLKVRF
jgi:Carboxypeptidase regulatory-like domain